MYLSHALTTFKYLVFVCKHLSIFLSMQRHGVLGSGGTVRGVWPHPGQVPISLGSYRTDEPELVAYGLWYT